MAADVGMQPLLEPAADEDGDDDDGDSLDVQKQPVGMMSEEEAGRVEKRSNQGRMLLEAREGRVLGHDGAEKKEG